jgi:hypothetical protein
MAPGRLRLCALVLAGLAAGCAEPAQIASNKAPDYAGDPKRLSVLESMGPPLDDTYFASFQTRLQNAVHDCGVEADFIVRPPAGSSLALDDKQALERRAEAQRIQQFRPEAVLSVVATSYQSTVRPRIVQQVTYQLELLDMKSRKAVWKAEVVMRPGAGDTGARLASDITARLATDGILRRCPAA